MSGVSLVSTGDTPYDISTPLMNNNFPEKKNGIDYLERIRKGTNRDFERKLRTDHRSEFETFHQRTIQETKGVLRII
jgi:hypothetical protein